MLLSPPPFYSNFMDTLEYLQESTLAPNGEFLTPTERLALFILALGLDPSGEIVPEVDRLARRVGVARRSMFRILAELKRKGALEAIPRLNDKGQDAPTLYRLLDEQGRVLQPSLYTANPFTSQSDIVESVIQRREGDSHDTLMQNVCRVTAVTLAQNDTPTETATNGNNNNPLPPYSSNQPQRVAVLQSVTHDTLPHNPLSHAGINHLRAVPPLSSNGTGIAPPLPPLNNYILSEEKGETVPKQDGGESKAVEVWLDVIGRIYSVPLSREGAALIAERVPDSPIHLDAWRATLKGWCANPRWNKENIDGQLQRYESKTLKMPEFQAPPGGVPNVPYESMPDRSACPDCNGVGWYFPEGTDKGAAKCRHANMQEVKAL